MNVTTAQTVTPAGATIPAGSPAVLVTCTDKCCKGGLSAVVNATAAALLDNKGLHNMLHLAHDRRMGQALARRMGPWAA